ncbi:IDEAL domain-containing protein [Listeria grandensis]|uniref:IDEAL domain-containing protein n=1 Tax=Listeria grandensis TaxID=1494963 RepID=A0A7X0Y2T1_9LIST|nr:IDEAL domain-containing protein [Listeria grandensis]MBC1474415.1 IDEAL domain-containing protein [Listeria grandensis]MBC1935960.1 IDEAL domain-containing protein [Listeria grandensis]
MSAKKMSEAMSHQYRELEQERVVMDMFIECFMTMLAQKQRLERIQAEIDLALETQDKQRFYRLTTRLRRLQGE